MKADNGFGTTGHNRIIKVTDTGDKSMPELTIVVNYQKQENDGSVVDKAVCLDHVVIPRIVSALNDATPETLLQKLQDVAESFGFVSKRARALLEQVADDIRRDPRNQDGQ